MSFVIQAPYPASTGTLLLPSPQMGNSSGLAATVQTVRTMSGKLFTYIKSKRGRKRLQWDFLTSKYKALEAKEFVSRYAGNAVRVIDHTGVMVIGYITINPVELAGGGRAGGWPSSEAYSFSLELDEKV